MITRLQTRRRGRSGHRRDVGPWHRARLSMWAAAEHRRAQPVLVLEQRGPLRGPRPDHRGEPRGRAARASHGSSGSAATWSHGLRGTRPRRTASLNTTERLVRALFTVLGASSPAATSSTIRPSQSRTRSSSMPDSKSAPKNGRSRLRPWVLRSRCEPAVRYGRRAARNPLQNVSRVSRQTLTSPRSIDSSSLRRAVSAELRVAKPRRVDSVPSDWRYTKRQRTPALVA